VGLCVIKNRIALLVVVESLMLKICVLFLLEQMYKRVFNEQSKIKNKLNMIHVLYANKGG